MDHEQYTQNAKLSVAQKPWSTLLQRPAEYNRWQQHIDKCVRDTKVAVIGRIMGNLGSTRVLTHGPGSLLYKRTPWAQ